MTISLPNADKIALATNHIKNLLATKYNVELSKLVANQATTIDQTFIASLDDQLEEADRKIAVLQAVIDELGEE